MTFEIHPAEKKRHRGAAGVQRTKNHPHQSRNHLPDTLQSYHEDAEVCEVVTEADGSAAGGVFGHNAARLIPASRAI